MKSGFQSLLTENYHVDTKTLNKDRSGLVVHSSLAATDKAEVLKHIYTINFYNTTSKILVNKLHNVVLLLDHYENILAAALSEEEEATVIN